MLNQHPCHLNTIHHLHTAGVYISRYIYQILLSHLHPTAPLSAIPIANHPPPPPTMPSPPPSSAYTDPAPALNRLKDTFSAHPVSSHPTQWDQLWKDSYTPWDRGTPSLALADLLTEKRSLFPPNPRPTALVPGCGRGYDVLLLSALGYDVTGLDASSTSLARAAEIEATSSKDEVYAARDPARGKGKVTWVKADFFDEGAEGMKGRVFDLVFDYTVRLPSLEGVGGCADGTVFRRAAA